ncbi:glycosyltransferase family 39 protein [Candidatus Sumerlaeota bacterium]|nr:glycosyltransferase family 39 protein [Candidatus Sumerlaeota bacterium]
MTHSEQNQQQPSPQPDPAAMSQSSSAAELELDRDQDSAPQSKNDALRGQTGAPFAPSQPRLDESYDLPPQGAKPALQLPFTAHLTALLFALLALGMVLSTYRGQGWTWDEAYYLKPSQNAVEFWTRLLRGDFRGASIREAALFYFGNHVDPGKQSTYLPAAKYAVRQIVSVKPDVNKRLDQVTNEDIDRHPVRRQDLQKFWNGQGFPGELVDNTPEAPPLTKYLEGLSLRQLHREPLPLWIPRLPSAVMFALTLYLIVLLAEAYFSRSAAVFAALLYLTLPRVLGHAHFAVTDTATAFIMLLCVYCFLRGLASWRWAVAFGVALGLALLTRIHAVLLPAALLPWALIFRRKQSVNNLYAMLLLAPAVWIALWPWLWFDTPEIIMDYVRYFLQHSPTRTFYLGQVWGQQFPQAPWHYAPVMIAATTPLLTLTLLAFGLLRGVLRSWREPHSALFLLMIAVNLAMFMRPSAAKYDGVRLFLPAYPWMALLGGAFCAWLLRQVSLMPLSEGSRWSKRDLATCLFGALIIISGACSIALAWPRFLSYYNVIVAAQDSEQRLPYHTLDGFSSIRTMPFNRTGFETTYWCDAVDEEVERWLREELPPDIRNLEPVAQEATGLEHRRDIFRTIPERLRFRGFNEPDGWIIQHREGMLPSHYDMLYHPPCFTAKTFEHRGRRMVSIVLQPRFNPAFKTTTASEKATEKTPLVVPEVSPTTETAVAFDVQATTETATTATIETTTTATTETETTTKTEATTETETISEAEVTTETETTTGTEMTTGAI